MKHSLTMYEYLLLYTKETMDFQQYNIIAHTAKYFIH